MELFRHQYERNAPYRRLCAALGRTPQQVRRWREIPAVPAGAFKTARLAAFPEADEVRVFRTSGSTHGRRGTLHLDTLELYDASLRATFGAYILAGDPRIRFVVLAPSASEAPDSSLSYMFDRACQRFGTRESRFYATRTAWNPEKAIADLEQAREPVALLGTAFAFVHLIDALQARGLRLTLPESSRVMETGGFKGRSREVTREELHGSIRSFLGVPRWSIVNQYGMCELGSQFYEASLLERSATNIKRVPPWVRSRVVTPGDLRDVAPGETGILIHYDLANTGSVLAVQTSDEGRAHPDGFEVLGRVRGAEARGCSLAVDALFAEP